MKITVDTSTLPSPTEEPERYRREYMRLWLAHPVNKEKNRLKARRHRLAKYGLSEADWEALWMEQLGRCKLCEVDFTSKTGRAKASPHVDHCHETGKVRGLLCATCNKALGMLGDTPDALERAWKYTRGEY